MTKILKKCHVNYKKIICLMQGSKLKISQNSKNKDNTDINIIGN